MRKLKTLICDSVWSIAALIIMNGVLQLIAYPILRGKYGAEEYGNILYLMGIVNIIAVSVGCSVNNSRLKFSKEKRHIFGYKLFLIFSYVMFLPISGIVFACSGRNYRWIDLCLYWLLMCITTYRNYADVKYRLNVNYKGYFFYYLAVSLGYVIGIGIFAITHKWMLLFLTGELMSVIAMEHGNKKSIKEQSVTEVKNTFSSIGTLLSAQLLVNTVLNADRLILKFFVGNTAVTIYYAASLIGKMAALITAPLNSVLIGHLVKGDRKLSYKEYLQLSGMVMIMAVFVWFLCMAGSHIFVRNFYPQEYQMARELFIWANAAFVLYFFSGIIMTVLLCYIKEKYQLYINAVYCVVFLFLTIPASIYYGIKGFAITLFLVNLFRFLFAVFIGAFQLKKVDNQKER